MLSDILAPFCVYAGYKPVSDRLLALQFINRAAKEVYDELEPDDGLSEVVLVVPRDLQLSLPFYIGELRGIREYKYSTLIPLQSIGSPQYSSNTWQFLWRNWRQKAPSPIHTTSTNVAPLTLTSAAVETTPTVVSIAMQTASSNLVVETVTMNAVTKQTTHSPVKILSISTASVGRQYNVIVSNSAGTEIAVLHNNEQKTRYRVIDVSQYQWSNPLTGDDSTLAEVLFKPTFFRFYNDTDEFIAPGYDDAICYKAMSFWCFGQEGKEADAIGYERKSVQAMDLAQRNQESGENKQLLFQPNPVYSAFSAIKWCGGYGNSGRNYGGQAGDAVYPW